MTHDVLCPAYCPAPDLTWKHDGASLPKCRGGDCTLCDECDCKCDLIARVREDERAKARERVHVAHARVSDLGTRHLDEGEWRLVNQAWEAAAAAAGGES